MTVGELGERMDAAELMEWQAFDRVHTPDSWYRNAALRLTVARLAGDTRTTLEDLLPPRDKLPTRQADPFGVFCAWAERHNARLGVGPAGEAT